MALLLKSMLLAIFISSAFGDEIEMEVQSNSVLKMLREMVNQTTAEAMNLPANATSIRENIVDTFSCENRTYGYYADVDNECQLFHVCLPVQLASGRNLTYKYSFVCPKETVFNQEVLVCTRPRESIPCEESESFYYLNMEIGKIVDPDANKEDGETDINKHTENIPVKENVGTRKQNRNQNRKKQNIIMDALLRDAEEQMSMVGELDEEPIDIETDKETKIENTRYAPEINTNKHKEELDIAKIKPDLKIKPTQFYPNIKTDESLYPTEIKIEPVQYYPELNTEISEQSPNTSEIKEDFENSRLGSERSSKRTGRKMWRGSTKFKTV